MSENLLMLTGEKYFKDGINIYIHKYTENPKFPGSMHTHDFIEIVYIVSGRAIHKTNESETEVGPGDIVLVNYSAAHGFFACEETAAFTVYDLLFTPDFIDENLLAAKHFEDLQSSFLLSSLFPDEFKINILNLSGRRFDEFNSLFQKIFDEYNRRDKGYEILIRALTIEIISNIFREAGRGKNRSSSGSKQEYAELSPADVIVKYVEENYTRQIFLSELSNKVFLSADYIGKLFKEKTGQSFTCYLKGCRLKKACQMLEGTPATINAIWEECGFPDARSFYTAFNEEFGITPKEYKKKHTK